MTHKPSTRPSRARKAAREALVIAAALFCAVTGYKPSDRTRRERKIVIE